MIRSLLPEVSGDLDAASLDRCYATGGEVWLRANFAVTPDGAVEVDGRSGGLGGPEDRRLFTHLRSMADVVLVGSGTVRSERYGPVRLDDAAVERRVARGQHPGVPVAVLTTRADLRPTDRLFAEAANSDDRPLVLTTAAAPAPARAALAEVAEVEICGDAEIDDAAALAALRRRGLGSVLCEGGPTILTRLLSRRLVDEVCLTIAPLLAGPGHLGLVAGPPWDAAVPLRLVGLCADADGRLFAALPIERLVGRGRTMSDGAPVTRLTEWTSCGGCAAKWGGAPLASLVRSLGAGAGAGLLVGLAPFDDAAVWRISDEVALVSTTDFFPPLVDDPADFGAIAAANACSDVFAMGGRVVLALNVAAFPEALPVEVVADILTAAAATVAAAGGTVAGGHTIRSEEPIFGLAVQGTVHPDRIWTKGGARAGDRLLLSKPVGTGIVLAGGDAAQRQAAITVMRRLNRAAAEALGGVPGGPHAVTDVTGFGLAGHAWEMAERSGVRLAIDGRSVPLLSGALDAARAGTRTGGDARNRTYLGDRVHSSLPEALEALCFDPQTSGGLLAAVPEAAAGQLRGAGFVDIGAVEEGEAGVDLRWVVGDPL